MYKYALFFLLLWIFSSGNAQENTISQKTIDTITLKFTNAPTYKQIKKSLENNASIKGWTKYYLYKSYRALTQRENDSAMLYAIKGMRDYQEKEKGHMSSDKVIHKLYYIKGLREYFEGDIEESLKSLNKGLVLTDGFSLSKDNTSWKFYLLERISIIHMEKGDYKLALLAKKQELNDSLYMSFKYDAGNTYRDLGSLFFEYMKQGDSAKYFFHKAIRSFENSSTQDYLHTDENSYFTSFANTYNALGDVFYNENVIDSSLFYYTKSNAIFNKKDLKETISKSVTRYHSRANNAFILFKKDKIDTAISILNAVRDSIRTYTDYNRGERGVRIKTHNFLSLIQSKKGNFKAALESQKELNNYLIHYNEENISRQLQLFSTQYSVAEKDASIYQLEETSKNQEIILKQQNTINWVLGGLLLAVVGLGFLFFKQRKQKDALKAVSLEQRLLRSQLNPHFLFNALNTASSLAHQKSGQTTAYISKLGGLLRSVLENSREEFISLEEEIDTLTNYLELQSDFSKKFTYKIVVSQDIDKEEVLIPPMFIQPFIENAIQYGFKGKPGDEVVVRIKCLEEKKTLFIEIENNGVAYSKTMLQPENSKHNSLSGKILKERLAIYAKGYKTKSFYTITDLVEGVSGTKVDLYLPLVKDV